MVGVILHLCPRHEWAREAFRSFMLEFPECKAREPVMQATDPEGNVHVFKSVEDVQSLCGLRIKEIISHDGTPIPDRLRAQVRP